MFREFLEVRGGGKDIQFRVIRGRVAELDCW